MLTRSLETCRVQRSVFTCPKGGLLTWRSPLHCISNNSHVLSKPKKATRESQDTFYKHFAEVYGCRWPALFQRLLDSGPRVAWANLARDRLLAENAADLDQHELLKSNQQCDLLGLQLIHTQLPAYAPATSFASGTTYIPAQPGAGTLLSTECKVQAAEECNTIPPPQPDEATGLKPYYILDFASVLPVLALNPSPGDRVLDLCAAPGGKSLVISSLLFGNLPTFGLLPRIPSSQQSFSHVHFGSYLVCNDRSAPRRARLQAVIKEYLPVEACGGPWGTVEVTGFDGTSRNHQFAPSSFDLILLDAPCSSERHVIHKHCTVGRPVPKEDWSPSRSSRNASTQASLIACSLPLLRPGGRLVYSTCSISPTENDAVIQRALKRWAGQLQLSFPSAEVAAALESIMPGLEATAYGCQALPDRTGWGPIYFAVLEKL